MVSKKKELATQVEKKLQTILGNVSDEELVLIMKKYLRTKNQVTKKGGCNCQNLEKIRGGFVKKLINKASVGAQNLIRKSKQNEIENLRLLAPGEGIHIPTCNYCGPGTNLDEADKYGPVKHSIYGPIDKICQKHDYNYDNASKESDKEKRKQMILEADRLMLEELEALPEDLKKNLTWKASKYGIALKHGFESLTGKMLYGGNPKYDLDKMIRYIVKNNITNVDSLKKLGKAQLVDVKQIERLADLENVKKINEDKEIKKMKEEDEEDEEVKEKIKKMKEKNKKMKEKNKKTKEEAGVEEAGVEEEETKLSKLQKTIDDKRKEEEDIVYIPKSERVGKNAFAYEWFFRFKGNYIIYHEIKFKDENTGDILHLFLPLIDNVFVGLDKGTIPGVGGVSSTTLGVFESILNGASTELGSNIFASLINAGFVLSNMQITGKDNLKNNFLSKEVFSVRFNWEETIKNFDLFSYKKTDTPVARSNKMGRLIKIKPVTVNNVIMNYAYFNDKINKDIVKGGNNV